MKQGYVKLIFVLMGLTLVLSLFACRSRSALKSEVLIVPDDSLEIAKQELGYSGHYVCTDSSNMHGLLKVYGPTPSGEIMFSLLMVADSGCMADRTGRARLIEKTKAVHFVVNTNCQLEFNFEGGNVLVTQNQCPSRSTSECRFDGIYVLSTMDYD